MKVCTGCGVNKLSSEFYKRSDRPNGLTPHCKECERGRLNARNARAREYYRKLRPKPTTKACRTCKTILQLNDFPVKDSKTGRRRSVCKPCHNTATRAYKQANREQVRLDNAAYREGNALLLSERQRTWRKDNPERYAEIHSKYKRNNKDTVNAATHRRRAKLAQVITLNDYTVAEWRALKARYGHKCLMCGLKKPLTVDHVIPIVMGGNNTIHNIQPLCKSCNSKKGVTILDLRMQVATITHLKVVS